MSKFEFDVMNLVPPACTLLKECTAMLLKVFRKELSYEIQLYSPRSGESITKAGP